MDKFDWKKTIEDMTIVFKLTKEEIIKLSESPILKIIAALPFIAKCEDADRCSYVNLSSCITAFRLGNKSISSFRYSDISSISRRLQYLFNFRKGNKKILKKGMQLIKYAMLLDYKKDLEEDNRVNKDNPLNISKFNFNKEILKIEKTIKSDKYSTEIDSLFIDTTKSAKDTIAIQSFWIA